MAAIQQQSASGQLPVVYVAKIEKFRKKGFDIFESIQKADEEVRKEQAEIAPPAPEGMGMPPEMAPGLAGGPEMMGPQGQAPPSGEFSPEAAQQLMGALRSQ
jgi:hypothetical protein